MAKVAVISLRKPKTHATAGNFVGVCPVIGRGRTDCANCFGVSIRAKRLRVAPFEFGFKMREKETHGGVY